MKKGNILKGTASTKGSKESVQQLIDSLKDKSTVAPAPATLFPINSKTPIGILNERCSKQIGWNNPNIITKQLPNGKWSGSVILSRLNSKKERETVRMAPPVAPSPIAIEMNTAIEAKHWLALYALYRFSNNLQLKLQLPAITRPYWALLEIEKANSPKNKLWLWSLTPFETALEAPTPVSVASTPYGANSMSPYSASSVSTTPLLNSGTNSRSNTPSTSRAPTPLPFISVDRWNKAPEVRMASNLRTLVEETVSVSMMLGQEEDASEEDFTEMDLLMVAELEGQGFRAGHIRSAIVYVNSSASTSTAHKFGLVEQYLLLSIAEEDLPPHYRLSRPPDSNARISTALDSDELAFNWRCESLSKTTGFPISYVETAMSMKIGSKAHIGLATDLLLRRLMGWIENDLMSDREVLETVTADTVVSSELEERRSDEVMGLEGIFGDRFRVTDDGLEILISDITPSKKRKDQVVLRVFYHSKSQYPSPPTGSFLHLPTFYIYSSTLPTYIRLHLNSLVQAQMLTPDFQELLLAGLGGVIIEMVNYLIEIHETVIANPPSPKSVLAKLSGYKPNIKSETSRNTTTKKAVSKSYTKKLRRDVKIDNEMRETMERNYLKKEFQTMAATRAKLPAHDMKQELINLIKNNRVVIVAGETGSGKTTQVPSFVLDDLVLGGLGSITNMIVTQPRRVSAIGVATRVGQERLENINNESSRDLVGYAIRGERKANKNCKLLFCTTGVVLARLTRGGDGDLEDVSHIFIDEVHERSVDSDFLLLELREILKRNLKIKVILMSATINQEQFSNYFGGAPCITIQGFAFPVKDHYLEDILPLLPTSFHPSSAKPNKKATQIQLEAMRQTFIDQGVSKDDERTLMNLETITRSEKIDYQLLGAVTAFCLSQNNTGEAGDVLVFMTGVMEIQNAIEAIKAAIPKKEKNYEIFPLHANLTSQEQISVFLPLPPGIKKIVVATNVAETSITIDGISYVVDCGRVKENTFTAETSMVKLEEQWTSRASAKQRRGRAGRTRPGDCYKLFTHYTEDNFMLPHPTPEMVRIPLEMLILMLKSIKVDVDVKEHLSKALSPPDTRAIDSAWNTLLLLGAVEDNGPKLLDFSARLTPLGKHLGMIPVDLRLGKMLILGSIFSALSPIVTIVALLSSKPLFLNSMDKRDEIKRARNSFYVGKSDLLSDLKAFDGLINARATGGNSAMKHYAEENFISLSTFRDVMNLRGEYLTALSDVGFVPFRANVDAPALNQNSDNSNLLKSIIFAGTGRLVTVKVPAAKYDQGSTGAIEREKVSKEVKFFEPDGRVFIHPASLLFSENKYPTPFLTYFSKHVTTKPFLRDATSIPFYAILLFGPKIQIDLQRGLIVGDLLFRAWPRIGVLVSELRRLFDSELEENFDSPNWGGDASDTVRSMLALLEKDGSGSN